MTQLVRPPMPQEMIAAIVLLVAFVLLLALKLAGFVAWSWWWICSPLLLAFGVIILIAILFFTFYSGPQ